MENRLKINIKEFMYDEIDNPLISNFNIELCDNNILWLQGEVGCGKTTLLKIIAGIIPNFESGYLKGEVLLDGKEIGENNFSEIAFCFQHTDNQLLFDSVRRQFWGDEEQVQIFLDKIGIGDISHKSVMDLSRGQRKFVSLMSTIRKNRRVYIFDEPLDLLDSRRKDIVLKEIKKISENAIVIISSHDEEVGKIANMQMNYRNQRGWEFNSSNKRIDKKNLINLQKKSSKDVIIDLKETSYCYTGNNQCLKFPSLRVYRNEILGVYGDNGSGKTTFLKLLSNIISPTEENSIERDFKKFGFMSQNVDRQLFGNTVYEELFIGLTSVSKKHIKFSEYLLKKFNLYDLKDKHPTFLSGGQKQKLVFASLMMHDPDILFLDEIFTNLDFDSLKSIIDLIYEYREKNDLTIILTDQDRNYLNAVCERIITL